jgi:type II secretory pathway component PulF
LRRKVQASDRWRLKLYRKLAAGYRAGTGFSQTILQLAERAQRRRPQAALTRALVHWAERIEYEGALLPDVLQGWVQPIEQMIIASMADQSAADRGPERAAWFLAKKIAQASTTKASLVYPMILVTGLFVMVFVLGTKVLPSVFAMQTAQGGHPPTYLVFLAQYAWCAFVPLALAVIGVRHSLPLWTGERRTWWDLHIWPWIHWRRTEGHAFLFAFSALWGSGLTDLAALHALCADAPPWRRERIAAIATWLGEGHGLAEAMDLAGHGFPDPEIIEDIAGLKVDPAEMAAQLAQIAEDAAKDQEESYRMVMMFLGIGIMALSILSAVAIAVALVGAFDFAGTADLLNGNTSLPH